MADIELRFHRDMLVLSAPIDYRLAERGVDVDADMEFMSLFEDDTVSDLLSMEQIAGAACLVTNTEGICRARLAHRRMEDAAADIARSPPQQDLPLSTSSALSDLAAFRSIHLTKRLSNARAPNTKARSGRSAALPSTLSCSTACAPSTIWPAPLKERAVRRIGPCSRRSRSVRTERSTGRLWKTPLHAWPPPTSSAYARRSASTP